MFLESNFVTVNRLFVSVYIKDDASPKRFKIRGYYLKCMIKNYKVISNGKNFNDHPINFDLKRYEEIRKLRTGQGGD